MGDTQKDKNLELARQLQAAIEEATEYINQLKTQIGSLERESVDVQTELQRLANRQAEIQGLLVQRKQELQVCVEQVEARETQYMKFLESQPTLVRVLKGGR